MTIKEAATSLNTRLNGGGVWNYMIGVGKEKGEPTIHVYAVRKPRHRSDVPKEWEGYPVKYCGVTGPMKLLGEEKDNDK